jgi:HAD superfamily hydrolase (TIGR01459 family)
MFLAMFIVDNCMLLPKTSELRGIREVADKYDAYFIDLWGVIHNGLACYPEALLVLEYLKKKNKKIILISNAPRPSKIVSVFLEKIHLPSSLYDILITSGDETKEYITIHKKNKKFYHLGPDRDQDLFKDLNIKLFNKEESDEIICTGLFFAENEKLEQYDSELKLYKQQNKVLVCANPDEAVFRGNKKELCAGALAKKFEELGGQVIYFGKPYKSIYYSALKKLNLLKIFEEKKINLIAIGDNLKTDIEGANSLNIDSIFITNGLYKNFFQSEKVDLEVEENLSNIKYYQKNLAW